MVYFLICRSTKNPKQLIIPMNSAQIQYSFHSSNIIMSNKNVYNFALKLSIRRFNLGGNLIWVSTLSHCISSDHDNCSNTEKNI